MIVHRVGFAEKLETNKKLQAANVEAQRLQHLLELATAKLNADAGDSAAVKELEDNFTRERQQHSDGIQLELQQTKAQNDELQQ